jgi:hypothetical protein
MRVAIRFAITALLFVAVLPFIVLSAIGVMKPAEGFCLENGLAEYGDAPTREEAAASYFVSPELGEREYAYWPACLRSRRGLHRLRAGSHDRALERLGEPNLARLHVEDPDARVLRVLTAPSFSRVRIAVRVHAEPTGGATAHAVWLVDERQAPQGGIEAEASDWDNVALPQARSQAAISREAMEALWALARSSRAREPTLDGNWLVIEMIDAGRREARVVLLDDGSHGAVFCRLAALTSVPPGALEAGDVFEYCAGDAG